MSSFEKEISFSSSNNNSQPVQSSILRLSQKIFDLNKSHQNNHAISQYSELQNKVYDLQGKLQESIKFVATTIKSYRQNLLEMNQKLIQNQSRCQLSKKLRSNEINQLGQKIKAWIQLQKKNRLNAEQKILTSFEQKIQLISYQFAKQIQNRKIYLNCLDQQLQQNLPSLKQDIIKELQTSALMFEQINKRLDLQTTAFKECLRAKDSQLNKQTKKVMELLGETVVEIKRQIQVEKNQRERKKNQIMELFEGAYKKLMF